MRTTLVLRDDLIESAKKRAAERKTTLSAIVDEALMMALKPDAATQSKPMIKLPTYAPQGFKLVDTSAEELSNLLVAEDMEPYGDHAPE